MSIQVMILRLTTGRDGQLLMTVGLVLPTRTRNKCSVLFWVGKNKMKKFGEAHVGNTSPPFKIAKFFVPIVFDLVREGSIYDKNCYYYLSLNTIYICM
jgi:hypothetical protein